MGSDGLFDNLFEHDIEKCLYKEIEERQGMENEFMLKSVNNAASCIGKKAYKLSKKTSHESPFAKEAKKEGKWYKGGKPDDITVIVSEITRQ